jgi:hypothetical protein
MMQLRAAGNRRITVRFDGEDAVDVKLEDRHRGPTGRGAGRRGGSRATSSLPVPASPRTGTVDST